MNVQAINPVRVAARQAFKDSEGDRFKATQLLADRVRTDPILRAALLDPLILNACDAVIREIARGERDQIFSHASAINAGTSSVNPVLALASGIENTLLNTPLRCGVRLRDATAEQVQAEADYYDAIARDAGQKARFYSAVARLVPSGKTVSQVRKLTESYMLTLFEGAAHG